MTILGTETPLQLISSCTLSQLLSDCRLPEHHCTCEGPARSQKTTK
ncbi:hypothetical protein LEMLEM_LOCUS16489 [Lemmus lemmus]